MKNFILQAEFFPDSDQARVTLTPIKPGARVIVEDVAWNDAYQTARRLLDEAFGVRVPDKSRLLFDDIVIDEIKYNLFDDLTPYSGA